MVLKGAIGTVKNIDMISKYIDVLSNIAKNFPCLYNLYMYLGSNPLIVLTETVWIVT